MLSSELLFLNLGEKYVLEDGAKDYLQEEPVLVAEEVTHCALLKVADVV